MRVQSSKATILDHENLYWCDFSKCRNASRHASKLPRVCHRTALESDLLSVSFVSMAEAVHVFRSLFDSQQQYRRVNHGAMVWSTPFRSYATGASLTTWARLVPLHFSD